MKAIIIDDELKARQLLQNLISANCPELQIVDACDDLVSGVKSIIKNKPDLIFLDIEMPNHNGLEILDFFSNDTIDFGIIFTTAYNQYAIQAFKLSAVDYLLKPIDDSELKAAVDRFFSQKSFSKQKLELLRTNLEGGSSAEQVAVPTTHGLRMLQAHEILYIKADNSYSEVYLSDGSKLLVSRTLKNFEDTLKENPHFFRTHKSYLVNLVHVADYVKSDGGFLVIKGTRQEIPITTERAQEFLSKIKMVKRS